MFAFFDSVLEFFRGIGRIISMMWDAVTGVIEEVPVFFENYIAPIFTFLPRVFGAPIGVTMEVIIVLLIALSIWEAIN